MFHYWYFKKKKTHERTHDAPRTYCHLNKKKEIKSTAPICSTLFQLSVSKHRHLLHIYTRCYIHSVDHEVPYTSLERDVGSVGRLLYFCRNTTKEDALQAHWLVVGKRRLPLGLLVHLNRKRSGKHPQRQTHKKY